MTSNGSEVLRNIGSRYEELGDGKFQTDMQRAIFGSLRASALEDQIRQSALSKLPKSGGINELVAEAPIYQRSSTHHRRFGISIIQNRSGHDLRDLDRYGKIRHPVFGNREIWVTTRIPKGYFIEPIKRNLPRIMARVRATAHSIIEGESI
jgi:hypothetical protein